LSEKHATPEGTRSLSEHHPELDYRDISGTGLLTSQAGFGCYRVSTGVSHHEQAMGKALLAGINLIDTSANYADGGSETLIGQVLQKLISSGKSTREKIIIVSKVGYLQGQNYTLNQDRKAQRNPFEELVDFGEGLAHCIHPEFLEDQLDRSLSRLNLDMIDFYLLHNPEYYLEWAKERRMGLDEARTEYYRRIQNAFKHLETEVSNGRIQYYGVSSNTFPASKGAHDFTCLDTLWKIAENISSDHHFRLVQLPFNLLEAGAVLENNQPGGQSILTRASSLNIGVLINRPLNALGATSLIRLADIEATKTYSADDIIRSISVLNKSENTFSQRRLPALNLQVMLQNRIKEQLSVGNILKHHWRNFSTYERWRETMSGNLRPRVQGVMDFLTPYCETDNDLSKWVTTHTARFETALEAVGASYAETASVRASRMKQILSDTDSDWTGEGSLSQKAIRAIRTTTGVTSVLVGMRRDAYVDDVLEELKRPIVQKDRTNAWITLQQQMN
jgi:aryl-alcohol dehydrogenase-like predicted oxidoreductase